MDDMRPASGPAGRFDDLRDGEVLDPAALHHKNKLTPYEGRELRGVVRRTLLRGQPIVDEAKGTLR